MALLLHQNVTRRAASVCGESPPLLPRRKRLGFPPGVAAALETDGEGGAVGGTGAAVPGFLRNPAMARRELLRQFYGASTWQQQMELLQSAEAQPLGLETRCAALLRGTGSSHMPPQAGARWGLLRPGDDTGTKRLAPPRLPT